MLSCAAGGVNVKVSAAVAVRCTPGLASCLAWDAGGSAATGWGGLEGELCTAERLKAQAVSARLDEGLDEDRGTEGQQHA